MSVSVTDADGVALLRSPSNTNQDPQEEQSEQILTTIFSLTVDQTSKVQMLGRRRVGVVLGWWVGGGFGVWTRGISTRGVLGGF